MRWFAAWALVLAAVGSAAQAQVWVLDTEKASRSERVAAAAVQGLANRGGPRVYLQPGESCWCMNPKRAALPAEVAARCRSMADEWIHYGQTVHGLKFEPVADLGALVAKVRDAVRGVVLYDASYPGDFEIALTQAGLLDGVPLTAAMREANPVLRALPIVFDTAAAHGARKIGRAHV